MAPPPVDYSLYLVTDSTPAILGDKDLVAVVKAAVEGGATIVQYRDKKSDTAQLVHNARELHKVTKPAGVPLLINDRVDVALRAGVEGVHVGQDDMDLKGAREILGPDAIIGVSTNTEDEAIIAARDGADYIGIGTVNATQTKDNVKSVIGTRGVQRILTTLVESGLGHVKTVCIGGMNAANSQRILYQSATPEKQLDGVAIVSAIMGSNDPKAAAANISKLINTEAPFVSSKAKHSLTRDTIVAAVPDLIARTAAKKPLCHNMTNLVVQNFAANVALAVGASPIMSNNGLEAGDLAALGGSLVINMGTTTPEIRSNHLKALAAYNAVGGPVIFDPVGAGATEQRREGVKALMAGGYFDLIKGNEGEIRTVLGAGLVKQHGVDSGAAQLSTTERVQVVKSIAARERNVVLMTGSTDVISDGERTFLVSNGHDYLGEITGSGCTLGTTVASVLAVERDDKLLAALAGILLYEIAAERAAKKAEGPGSFVPAFIDALYHLREASKQGDGAWAQGAKIEAVYAIIISLKLEVCASYLGNTERVTQVSFGLNESLIPRREIRCASSHARDIYTTLEPSDMVTPPFVSTAGQHYFETSPLSTADSTASRVAAGSYVLEEQAARSRLDVEAELVGPHAMGGTPGLPVSKFKYHLTSPSLSGSAYVYTYITAFLSLWPGDHSEPTAPAQQLACLCPEARSGTMRGFPTFGAYFLLVCGITHGLPEIAIVKHRHADVNPARLKRRQNADENNGTVETNTYDVLTWSTGGAYYANVTVGNPPQEQVVILDTGSSDLYFDSSTADTCQQTGLHSCRGGTFDHGASSTYDVVAESPAFNTTFGDGSTAVGPFAQDTVGIGDVRIDGVQFGVADEVESTTGFAVGLMGLGYSENEASRRQYPNIPEVLASSGEINSRLYSIYLNDIGETSGSVLFGGIDKSKYTGPLVTLNCLPSVISESVLQFVTTVTALSATVDSQQTEIFSGGTDSVDAYTNDDVTLAVSSPLFPFVDEHGNCDCAHRDVNSSITVTFGGKIDITVPARQFIVPLYDPLTNKPQFLDRAGKIQACVFMIVPAAPNSQRFLTLGDAVLRSVYTVFDLDNGQVSLAQAALNSSSEPDIVTVAAGPSGVARAAGASAIPSNSYSIAAAVSGGETFTASKIESTIGMATGTDAVPANARPLETGVDESGGGSGSGSSAASSSAAASAMELPGMNFGAFGSISVFGLLVFGGMLLM
ncbi:hypothetical protein Q7P37_002728 [Cladosporium fusiforme]